MGIPGREALQGRAGFRVGVVEKGNATAGGVLAVHFLVEWHGAGQAPVEECTRPGRDMRREQRELWAASRRAVCEERVVNVRRT